MIGRPRTGRRCAIAALVCIAIAASLAGATAHARSFRNINPIATPGKQPPGTERVAHPQPVDPALVRQAIDQIAAAWNTGALGPLLDETFVNRQRLLDTLQNVAPREARIRVLAVRSVATLDQFLAPEEKGGDKRISTVSAVVETQIEFNDPRTGFQRLTGTNEFILRVVEPLGP